MKLSFMHRLIPAIITWLVVVIVLSLAPTIETYNGHVTTNVAAATNAAYMLGMTAVDDFGGFIMIMGLLLSSGLFAVTSMKVRDTSIGDMMEVIGAVILSVIALSMLSGTIVGKIDELVTAGTGFAKTAYGILTIVIYLAFVAAGAGFTAYKSVGKLRGGKGKSKKAAPAGSYARP